MRFMEEPSSPEFSPVAAEPETFTARAWRLVLHWLGILLRALLQIARGTFAGRRDPLPAFEPLPAELPADPPPSSPLRRLTVVLDLDETLVCAYESSVLPMIVRKQAIEAGLECFELECISTYKEGEGGEKINLVTVFERPGLREFLRQISQFADLVLFTSALEVYASPLVDRIDIENRFRMRLYRQSTIRTEYREHAKDLACISKDLRRIVIVDNNPFSFISQPLNGIPCIPFTAGQPYDDQLMGVLLPFLKHLSQQKDVRPILHECFHMPEWFEKNGTPFNWSS